MTESQLQKAALDLLEALRLKGWPIIATRTNAGRVRTIHGGWVELCTPGWGDITAVIRAVPVMIECKSAKGVQRETQRRMQAMWEAAGGVYLLVPRLEILREYLGLEGTNDL